MRFFQSLPAALTTKHCKSKDNKKQTTLNSGVRQNFGRPYAKGERGH